MGNYGSKFSKPIRNWNIENRVHKIISQDKPKPAPTYDTTQKQIELVNKLEPDYKEKAKSKNQQLDEYLKKVYVTSNSKEIEEIDQRSNPDRPLPIDRLVHEGFQYGFHEPAEITPGRVSLRQTLEFLGNHKENPEKYTAEYIASEYKLDKELAKNILEHHKLFLVYNTTDDYNQDIIASHIPISQTTGMTVRFSEDKEDKDNKKIIEMTNEPKQIDDK